MFKKIKKRNKKVVKFNPNKITIAIAKAGMATGEFGKEVAKKLTLKVISLAQKIITHKTPTVEEIQDIVEEVLLASPYRKTAKAYIIYRDQHSKIREIKNKMQVDLIDQYLNEIDWQVKENSNMSYSLQGLNNYISSEVSKTYWLNKIYPPKIKNAYLNGDFHIHDLGLLSVYCVGWDLQDLLITGFAGVPGKIESKPAKHFRAALGQVVNFLYTLQGEAAGAQAFSNFDTLLSPFIRYDNLSYKEVKQAMQEFIFNMNIPTRVGFQTPYTNLTFDLVVPEIYADQAVIIGGKMKNITYSDFQKEMNMLNKAFLEVMAEGDAKGRVFTFPIPTYNITKDFDWDNPIVDLLDKVTAKYGLPYFSNFISSDMKPDDVRSMCCRLRLDLTELRKRGGGYFGANPMTGCYDEKTEILTKDGWKHFRDLTLDDEVFTLTKTNNIEVHKPKKIFVYDWDGDLYKFKAKSLDLLVTPNHKMVVDEVRTGKRKLIPAEKFDVNNYRIPKQGQWGGLEVKYFVLPEIENEWISGNYRSHQHYRKRPLKILMDDWLKFFGIYIAEGSVDNIKIAPSHGYRVFITQIKKKTKEEIKSVLSSLPFHYRETDNGFVITNKQLWSYLRQFGSDKNRFIPKEIKKLSSRQLKILFDWLIKGDGHIRPLRGIAKKRQITYYTISKRLADSVQEIAIKIGWMATITQRKARESYIKGRKIQSMNKQYTVGIQQSTHYRLRKNNIKLEHYRGKVYSCEVTNHTLLVRRNGKSCWSGNSVGVVTINIPRLGYLSKNENEFFERLNNLMVLAKDSLIIKRKVLEKLTDKGLYPYTKFYLRNIKKRFDEYWKNHFSTIGLLGMNEACLNLLGKDIGTPEGQKFAEKVLDFMRSKLLEFQKETGDVYNLEATPAEGTSYRLALKDKKEYPDIICANEKEYKKGAAPFYTNSSQLPVNYTDDIFEALDLQDNLQIKYTGGTVLHFFLGEKINDPKVVKNVVKKICEKYRLPYFTISPTFSVCPVHGYIAGEHYICPKCGRECEVYSRSVGYLRPVKQWNKGKAEEFKERKTFKIKK